MVKFFRQNKLLIIFLLTFLIMVGVGMYFALKKAEPEYLSKIDKIMFDTKNKSPKYVITLPSRDKRSAPTVRKEVGHVTDSPVQMPLTLEEVIAGVPSLTRITAWPNKTPLKYIANNPSMVEEESGMEVPKISSNGKKPWVEYGNKVNVLPNFYKVAVVIKGMGLDTALTELLIKGSPPNISYSFSPYGRNLDESIKLAREYGHETYADIVLDSHNYMEKDAGPLAMNVNATDEEIIAKIKKIISPKAPVGGVVVEKGQTRNKENVQRSMNFARDRGILMIDATKGDFLDSIEVEGLARKKADIIIDEKYSKHYVKEKLKLAEEIAIRNGQVLIVIAAKPSVLLLIKEWIDSFSPQYSYEEAKKLGIEATEVERPFAIVPVSAVVVE